MYDIAVVGAGPAGATFARLVADRYKVLVVDERLFPTFLPFSIRSSPIFTAGPSPRIDT